MQCDHLTINRLLRLVAATYHGPVTFIDEDGGEITISSLDLVDQLLTTMQKLKETDDALQSSADWSAQLRGDNDRLVEENAENCRLLGMSAERELALRAKLDAAMQGEERLREALAWVEWLFKCPEMQPLVHGNWGDPAVIRDKVLKALNANEYPADEK